MLDGNTVVPDASQPLEVGVGHTDASDVPSTRECSPKCAVHQVCELGSCRSRYSGSFSIGKLDVATFATNVDGLMLLSGSATERIDIDPGLGETVLEGTASSPKTVYAAFSLAGELAWHRDLGKSKFGESRGVAAGFTVPVVIPEGEVLDLGNGLREAGPAVAVIDLSPSGVPSSRTRIGGKVWFSTLSFLNDNWWLLGSFEGPIRLGGMETTVSGYVLSRFSGQQPYWTHVLTPSLGTAWSVGELIPQSDGSLQIFLAGWDSRIDLDPGPALREHGSSTFGGAVAAVYGAGGDLLTSGELEGTGLIEPEASFQAMNGDTVLAGNMYGEAPGEAWLDVDRGAGVTRLEGVRDYDLWMARYDGAGELIAAAQVVSTKQVKLWGAWESPDGVSIAFSIEGDATISSAGKRVEIPLVEGAVAVARLGKDLTPSWVLQFGGQEITRGFAHTIPGGFVLAGTHAGRIDVLPGEPVQRIDAGSGIFLVSRFKD